MRDGWRRVRIGEVARLDLDRVVVRASDSYQIAGVLNSGRGLLTRECVRGSATRYSVLYRLGADQLVVRKLTAWEGTIAIVPPENDGMYVSPEFPTFTLGPDLLPGYMRLLCRQPALWAAMKERSTGTVQRRKRVNPDQLLRIEIVLPPMTEQRRIVDLIGSIDAARERERELADATSAARVGLLGTLLMNREGWTEALLGQVAVIRIGRTPPRQDSRYWTSDLERPFCSIADMTGTFVRPMREGVTSIAESQGKAKRVPAGSLLLSFKLTIGRVGYAAVDLFPNEAIAWLDPDTRLLDKHYLGLWLGHQDLRATSGRAVKGQTLNARSLRAIPVAFPSLTEQRHIADLVESVDEATETAKRAEAALSSLRVSLLEELLSGSLELPSSYDRFLDAAS